MLKEPVLVVGAAGMLGRAVMQALGQAGREHEGCDRSRVDLSSVDSIARGVPESVGTVINCAGWTNVDTAEAHEEEASKINGIGVGQLAEHCQRIGAVLVHYSTDYVFSGDASEPYRVDHPRAPLNAYGRSKALGETLLEQSGASYLLLRTSWVYAPWGKNFVRTIVGLARTRPSLRVVSDQLGRPSSAEEVARVSLELLSRRVTGTFHVSDAGQCSWYDLARAAVARAGLSCTVEPCTSAEYPSPAVRPSYSVLDLSRTEEQLGPLKSWQQSVDDVVARLEPTNAGAR
jgi:dTDP-4-dehydrorhamnose reductase